MTIHSIDESPKTDNPGQVLRDLLSHLYPIDSKDNEKYHFLDEIDDALVSDGELKKVIYESVINYFTRRLLRLAQYKYDKNEEDNTGRSLDEIRSFLTHHTKLNKAHHLRISILLNIAAKQKRGGGKGLINGLLREAKEAGARCYICGREVSFLDKNDRFFAEVEHVWPLTMGGSNSESNLRISCKACNKEKASKVDSSDFHFEHLICRSYEGKESFTKDFDWHSKVASFMRSNSQCLLCGKTAKEGELMLFRSNSNDCWHYLNIDAYCQEHYEWVANAIGDYND